jgi:hypothetical protein
MSENDQLRFVEEEILHVAELYAVDVGNSFHCLLRMHPDISQGDYLKKKSIALSCGK